MPSDTPQETKADTREIRFTVWQFVRLMVHLEDRPKPSAAEVALLSAWAEVWAALDQDLTRLAEQDPDAYAEMMMDQEVVIEDANAALISTAKSALEAVMDEMDAAIEAAGDKSRGDDTLLDSLKFERRELRQLTRKLGRQA